MPVDKLKITHVTAEQAVTAHTLHKIHSLAQILWTQLITLFQNQLMLHPVVLIVLEMVEVVLHRIDTDPFAFSVLLAFLSPIFSFFLFIPPSLLRSLTLPRLH
jgi:hypothetical protein